MRQSAGRLAGLAVRRNFIWRSAGGSADSGQRGRDAVRFRLHLLVAPSLARASCGDRGAAAPLPLLRLRRLPRLTWSTDDEDIIVMGKAPRGSVDRRHSSPNDPQLARRQGDRRDQLRRAAGSDRTGYRARARVRKRERPLVLAQRPPGLELSRASRHSHRGHFPGRHPARGSRAQIRLSARPEGRERRAPEPLRRDGWASRCEHGVARGFAGGGDRRDPDLADPQPARRRSTSTPEPPTSCAARNAAWSSNNMKASGTGATGLLISARARHSRGPRPSAASWPGNIEATFNVERAQQRPFAERPFRTAAGAASPPYDSTTACISAARSSAIRAQWHWNLAGNGDLDRNRTTHDRPGAAIRARKRGDHPAAADLDGTLNGPLVRARPVGAPM